jgi:hypothetical protein
MAIERFTHRVWDVTDGERELLAMINASDMSGALQSAVSLMLCNTASRIEIECAGCGARQHRASAHATGKGEDVMTALTPFLIVTAIVGLVLFVSGCWRVWRSDRPHLGQHAAHDGKASVLVGIRHRRRALSGHPLRRGNQAGADPLSHEDDPSW